MNRDDNRLEQLRVPPQSIEAEQAVLGGLMLAPDAYDRVADLLEEGDFYRRDHQVIWRAVKHLAKKNRPYDAVTIGEFFDKQKMGELVAGGAYLVELASTTPSAANIRAYAEIVADKARLRRVIEVGTRLVNDGFQPDGRDSVEIIGQAQTSIGQLLNSQPCELESIAPVMVQVFEDMQERYNRGGGIDGMATGYTDFDEILNGLSPGLYILAGRPKQGKTTLAQNIAEYVALVHKKPVAIFSLEMQAKAIGNRMLSSIGDVDADRVRRGTLDDADWANVTAAIRRIRGAEIFISRPRDARVEHIIAQARRQHAKKPLGLIVIDYLQLIATSGNNKAQDLGDVTRALVMLAHELGVAVLLLSQLNRKLEDRPDKRPLPSDLRDSGAIEQDADAVILIYRDETYHKDSRWKGTAEIIVPLQRNGPPGECRLLYRPDRFRFENLPAGWEPEPLPPREQGAKKGFKKTGSKELAPRADVDA